MSAHVRLRRRVVQGGSAVLGLQRSPILQCERIIANSIASKGRFKRM